MSKQITLKSKTGKQIILTSTGRGLCMTVPALGKDGRNLMVTDNDQGVETLLGRKIIVQFEGADLAACAELVAAENAMVEKSLAASIAYQARHDYINAVR